MSELIKKLHNDPSVLRKAWEDKHGEYAIYQLYGALFANVSPETIERLFLEAVKEDS